MKAKEIIDRVNKGEKVFIPTRSLPIFRLALKSLNLKFSCDVIVNGHTACIVLPDATDGVNNEP